MFSARISGIIPQRNGSHFAQQRRAASAFRSRGIPMRSFLAGLAILFCVSGCMNDPVREDRAADWGRDGGTVAFQHDQDGVFVADREGNRLTKIWKPHAFVLVTS